MRIIDAHIHYYGDHEQAQALFAKLDVKLLNICVAHEATTWLEEAARYRELTDAHPQRYAWCTSFDPPDFRAPDYTDRVIAGLERDFAAGAVGCKIWKNIGMEIRKPDGTFLMVDDPLFDPIFEYLIEADKPVLMHIGEPLACWQPLDVETPHTAYYRENPQWHMYNRSDYPSHTEIIAARDRVLAKFPRLRVIGAHLASLEYDVDELAARLERYPNLAVDTSARLLDLAYQDCDKVRRFIEQYPDRILFGTDIVQRRSLIELDDDDRAAHLAWVENQYWTALAYYGSDAPLSLGARETRGLNLAAPVLEQLFWQNARAWYPGV